MPSYTRTWQAVMCRPLAVKMRVLFCFWRAGCAHLCERDQRERCFRFRAEVRLWVNAHVPVRQMGVAWRSGLSTILLSLILICSRPTICVSQDGNVKLATDTESLRAQREDFQTQQIITDKPFSWVIPPGRVPRLIWRDAERVRELGFAEPLNVRWFNAKLEEAKSPDGPGRWAACLQATAPNGTTFRLAFTFYVVPPNPVIFTPEVTVSIPGLPNTPDGQLWREREAEFSQIAKGLLGPALLDSEQSAILIAGLSEAKPLGHPARFIESTDVMNQDFHLALKLKQLKLDQQARPLLPPRRLNQPAIVLHHGTTAEAGVVNDATAQLDALCREWYDDSHEPFVTLVSRRGVILLHKAYGVDSNDQPIDLDYRCWVASITKTVTAMLFARLVDQQLIGLDDPLSSVFPDFPKNDPHVPTFRQCFHHTSGLAGGSDFGGMRNPHLENVVLNGIDVNEPGAKYAYSGMGMEISAKAMELVTGTSGPRLYHLGLFEPLGFGDVVMGNASSDGEFTVMELGTLAQMVSNRGRYGEIQLFSESTFESLLPEPLNIPGQKDLTEGIGLHWRLRGTQGFSERTVGHGSFSGCIFTIDLDNDLIITQVRRNSGDRHGEWSQRLFETAAHVVETTF